MTMTRQEQLDAVARNYGEWEGNAANAYLDIHGKVVFTDGIVKSPQIATFTRAEVEQRKAELQNKPSWDDAHDGANILVFCPDNGGWIFGSHCNASPDEDMNGWQGAGRGCWFFDDVFFTDEELIGDWRDTLEKRPVAGDQPTPEEEEAFKAMDNTVCEGSVASVWDGEGLPPVGILCEAFDHAKGEWVKGKMLMHGNSDHAFASGSPEKWSKLFWACKFRPIKSDREQWVEDCEDLISGYATWSAAAEAMYYALKSGKIKLPEVE